MGERQEVDYATEEVRRTVLVCDNCNAEVGFKEEGAKLKDVYFNPEFSFSIDFNNVLSYAEKNWRVLNKADFHYSDLRSALSDIPLLVTYDGKEGWCSKCVNSRDMKSGRDKFSQDDESFFSSLSRESKLLLFTISIIGSSMIALFGVVIHFAISIIFLLIAIALAVAAIELL